MQETFFLGCRFIQDQDLNTPWFQQRNGVVGQIAESEKAHDEAADWFILRFDSRGGLVVIDHGAGDHEAVFRNAFGQ